MHAGSCHVRDAPPGGPLPAGIAPAPLPPEPCTPAELRALVHGGETDSDLCETILARSARIEAALDLAIGDGLVALTLGSRLISLGFSNLGDYARHVLDIRPRTTQAMAHLSRALAARPILRAAVRAGEVRIRNAQTGNTQCLRCLRIPCMRAQLRPLNDRQRPLDMRSELGVVGRCGAGASGVVEVLRVLVHRFEVRKLGLEGREP